MKHNGPLLDARGQAGYPLCRARGTAAILEYSARQDLELATHAGAEAQAAAIADDIAYNAHDIDDGLRAGLFELDGLRTVPFHGGPARESTGNGLGFERSRVIHELVRRVITRFVEDVIAESERRLAALAPADADAVRGAGAPVVAFSDAMAAAERQVKAFLFANMYRHPTVMKVRKQADEVVRDLYRRFIDDPDVPPRMAARLDCAGSRPARAPRRRLHRRHTDRYALDEHRRLFHATRIYVRRAFEFTGFQ